MTQTEPRIISLAYLTMQGFSGPEHVAAAAEAGFRWVSLRAYTNRDPATSTDLASNQKLLQETRRVLDDTGVRVLDLEGLALHPDFKASDYEHVYEAAAYLGSRDLLLMGHDTDFQRMTASYAALCEAAAAYDIRPSLEYARFSTVHTLEQALDIVRGAAQPNGRVLIDALHTNRSRVPLDQVAGLDRGLLAYMQLCDARAESPGEDAFSLRQEAVTDRLLPGEGALPLRPLLDALPTDLPIAVEAPCRELEGMTAVERARRVYAATMRFFGEGTLD